MRPLLPVMLLAATLPAAAAEERPIVPWDEAEKHVGKEVTVEGRVVDIYCAPTSCLLAFEPSFNRFTAVIQAASFRTFPPAEVKKKFQGKRVHVTGKVVVREKKPEIIVDAPAALALASTRRREERDTARAERREERDAARAERREEREAARAERLQTEVLDRLSDTLGRIEELAERVAAVEERIETLVAHLEQRDAALAAAQSVPPAPPPEPIPSYGEPQPRPAYEALRTVKRGMSRNEVERLVGQPQYVETSGSGWTTWYYGFGRSVSFNARGRAQAVVGFPAP